MSTLKKLIIWLFVIMIIAFTISGHFFNRYGIPAENIIWSEFFNSIEKNTTNYITTETFDLADIEHISIKTVSENVIIEQSNEFSTGTITLTGYTSKEAVELSIKTINDSVNIGIDYNTSFASNLTLKLLLPEKQLDSITIETTSGNCDVEVYNCDQFEYNTISGDLNSSLLYAEVIQLNSKSGDFQLSSTDGKLAIKTVSGKIVTYYEDFDDTIDINTISGDVRLSFETPVDFELDFQSTSGNYNINLPVQIKTTSGDHKIKVTSGDGEHEITVNTTSGDLRVH